jgi:hypothetical protein
MDIKRMGPIQNQAEPIAAENGEPPNTSSGLGTASDSIVNASHEKGTNAIAKAILEDSSLNFITGEAEAKGDPEIKPGTALPLITPSSNRQTQRKDNDE